MWTADQGDDKVYAYTISDGSRDSDKDISVESSFNIWGIWSDGETMWIVDDTSNKVYSYDLPRTSSDATLSGLAVSAGTLDPTFVSGTADYDVDVGYGVTQITVTPTKSVDSSSVAFLDGADAALSDADTATGHQVNLAVGDTVIKVKVTAADSTHNTYTLTVTRAKPTVSISGATTAAEGDLLTFTVTRNASPDETLTVTVDVSETEDLVPAANKGAGKTYTILANVASAEVTVQTAPADDTWDEHSTVKATVRANAAYTLGTGTEAETLVEDDDFPEAAAVLSADANPVSEGGGPVVATITVTTARDEMPHGDSPATLNLSTASDTASSPADYSSLSVTGIGFATSAFTHVDTGGGVMRWRAVVDREIAITDDADVEEQEQFRVHLGRSPADTPISIDTSSTPKIVVINDDDEAASSDATLSALTLSGVTLAFDPATLSYTVSVGNDVDETTVTPTPNHAEASYAIKLNGAADPDGVIPLAVGGNVITVVVTAEDEETSRTYTVTITREGSLSTLTVVGTQPDPNIRRYTFAISWVDGFSCASGTNYYAYLHVFFKHTMGIGWRDLGNVASSANTMSVTFFNPSADPVLQNPNRDTSLVLYCGARASGREVGRVDVTDAVGTFIFPSTDSTLSALSVGGVPAPGFAPATTEYSMTVDNNVARTTVTPTLNHATASFQVTPEDADPDTDGHQVDLAVGANVITAVVTAQDDSTTTYTVTVTRVPSTDATLRDLTFSGIPGFQLVAGTLTYTVTPVLNLQSTTVAAATTHAGASYVVKLGGVEDADRVIMLAEGENVITVVVTAQDKMAARTYTVTVDNPAFIPGALPVIDSRDGQDVDGPFRVRFSFLKASNWMEAFPVTGFVLGDITVNNGMASNLQKAHGRVALNGAIWEATITPAVRGVGHDVVVSLAAGVVTEGNQAASLTVTTRSDGQRPKATLRANVVYFEDGSQSSVITRPTGLHIGFDERVTGLEINDFEVTNGQLEIGYLDVDADGNGHAVLVPKVSGPVQVAVRLKAGAVHDLAGNPNAATEVVLHVSPDDTPPEIVRIRERLRRVDDDGTHVWALTLVFSEPVTGFTAADVSISSGTKSDESGANHEYGTRWAIDIESDGGETPIMVSVAAGAFSDGNNTNEEEFSGEIDRSVPPPASDD